VALAFTGITGMLARWQDSQLVLLGMCEDEPPGLVGGMPTIRLMPAKLLAPPEGWWQLAQLLLIPAWFISELLNLAPSTTVIEGIDEPEPTWQVSHAALVGMWLLGRPTSTKPMRGMEKKAAESPWQVAHPAEVVGALAWMAVSDGVTEKLGLLWQALQEAPKATGMWFSGLAAAGRKAEVMWHWSQDATVLM
jgi:hypothetical protein